YLGMAEGLQPVFSSMKGTNDAAGLNSMRRFSLTVFCLIGFVSYVLVFLFSDSFYGLFTAGDEALLKFTAERSRAYFSGFLFAGINILLISYWQATEATAKGMVTALLRSAILPPVFILFIPMLAGSSIFWYGHSIVEALTAVIALTILLCGF
ncbi:MAG: hypothetical protein II920_08375, partial [Clostridia bacterium]|nr:hypothetical protein [Clostridia bacterium]